MSELISVIMPVFNGEKYISESISSLLKQSFEHFELIVINDGSTDQTEELILSIKDERLVYVANESNKGVSYSRNKGLDVAIGDYVTFQDADDISHINRLRELLDSFTDETIGLVHSDMMLFSQSIFEPIGYWASFQINKNELDRFFIKKGTPFNTASVMIRRKVIKNLRFDIETKIGEDTLFLFDCLNNSSWETKYIDKPLYFYRIHEHNSGSNADNQTFELHVEKLIEKVSLASVFPELSWSSDDLAESTLVGKAMMAWMLTKRGLALLPQKLIKEVLVASGESEFIQFHIAVTNMIKGDFQLAIKSLVSMKNNPKIGHIVHNYMGEACMFRGSLQEAMEYFFTAMSLNPAYVEPLENVKSIAGLGSIEYTNNSLTKYRRNK